MSIQSCSWSWSPLTSCYGTLDRWVAVSWKLWSAIFWFWLESAFVASDAVFVRQVQIILKLDVRTMLHYVCTMHLPSIWFWCWCWFSNPKRLNRFFDVVSNEVPVVPIFIQVQRKWCESLHYTFPHLRTTSTTAKQYLIFGRRKHQWWYEYRACYLPQPLLLVPQLLCYITV